MQDFRNLRVWRLAGSLMEDVYRVTATFPLEERYVLSAQMRRAAFSITSNISEGACRKGDVEFARFLQMAMGSASELENGAEMAARVGLLSGPDSRRLISHAGEVKKMLAGLIKALRRARRT